MPRLDYNSDKEQESFKIILVDDEKDFVDSISNIFQHSGYDSIAVTDPFEALEKIRKGHYDILVLDYLMHGMRGDEMVARIRQFNQELYILFLTGQKELVPPLQTIRTLDIQGYCEKSSNFDQIILLVESAVKSIRQMRMIQRFRDGLYAIIEAAPRVYQLQAPENTLDLIFSEILDFLKARKNDNAFVWIDYEAYETNISLFKGSGIFDFDKEKIFSRLQPELIEKINTVKKTKKPCYSKNFALIPLVIGFSKPIGIIYAEGNNLKDQSELLGIYANEAALAINNSYLHSLLNTKNELLGSALEKIEVAKKNLEKDVEKATKELRQKDSMMLIQSRYAQMGEMLGNIAHQWRQPLNAVGLLVQNIQDHYKFNKLDAKYLEETVKKTMEVILYMSQTIDDFRNFFKPDKEKSEFLVKDSINKALGIIGTNLKNNFIEVETDIEKTMKIVGYPNEYNQVLLNILSNSKDAFLERKVQKPLIKIRLFEENKKSVVIISDNAGGIDPVIMHKIFDPYFTSKQTGTGIGLYMSKNIIEKSMDGKLSAENIDNGALFKIEV
jgi:signal transduction histidine kinase/CheY-like chemotaxis protein